ncbi:MAG TPA: DcaP family trimeric outer membrane transporter [Pyrinomonadaceae bacterium]|nr:DcaP family trimeric outer membrane transporter [Pyrinomonadaceae bacterium]
MRSNRYGRTIRTGAFIFASALLMIAPNGAAAQTQAPPTQIVETPTIGAAAKDEKTEVERLRERLTSLERTVEELKGQLIAIEDAQKKTTPPVGVPQPSTSVTAPATTAVNIPADGQPAIGPTGEPAKKQDKSGNTFEVYGFVMTDAGYQFKQNHPDWFDVLRTTKLPSFENEFGRDGNTFFGVRQSRFGVKSSTPTKWGDLKTTFEFELFGTGADAGQTTFRLRHAYAEIGQFGAGQYWSPFMDIDTFPNTIEYWGPTGMPLFRNVQVRWMPIKGRSFVTIALERPGASGDAGVVADRIELDGIKPKFQLPDLSWEARYGKDWGYVEIAGILRSMKWVDTNDDKLDLGGSDVGWGFNLTSNLNFNKKKDVARLGAVYGEGIQNYMNDSPVDVGAEFDATDPTRPIKGRAIPIFGMLAYLDHKWNDKFTSSVGYSFQNNTNTSAQADSAFHRGHYASGNLLWTPIRNAMFGAEFIWGRRENYRDGFASDDSRIQLSFKYNFSKLIEW